MTSDTKKSKDAERRRRAQLERLLRSEEPKEIKPYDPNERTRLDELNDWAREHGLEPPFEK